MSAIGKLKNLMLVMAVIVFIAIFATLFITSNDVIAHAEEVEYFAKLTKSSVEYNGKAFEPAVIVTKDGVDFSDYTITCYKGEEIVTELKSVGSYTVSVAINDTDPAMVIDLTFTINPKPLKVVIGGSSEFLYSGMGYTRNVSPLGICDGDEVEIITTYSGDYEDLEPGVLPVNADNYEMLFDTNNPNYVVGDVEGDARLVITKRTLYVKVNDTQITEGGTPEFTYEIIGFVGDEDESVIDVLPSVNTNASVVGVHKVNASGAKAKNYTFEYTYGNLTINDTTAFGEIEGTSITFDVSGVFAPLTSYTGYTIEGKSEEGKELVKTAREYRMLNFTSDVQYIYQISYYQGVQVSEKIDVVFHNVTLDSDDKYVIVVIDPNGVVTQITKYDYLNGTLSFKTPSLGTIMIFKDTYNMSVLYITLGAIVVFIVLLFIGAKMQYRNDKRHIDEAKKRKKLRQQGKYEW